MSDPSVWFEVLGTLRVRRGQEELELGPAKQQAVLATLLVSANQPVPPSRIIAAVWGEEPPANGANVVQKHVAGLRRLLEPGRAPRAAGEVLALVDGGYRLSVAAGGSDVDVYESQVRTALRLREAGRLAEASEHLQHALALWRSEPLEGLAGPVFDAARRRLLEHRAGAVEEYAEIELELGRHELLAEDLAEHVAAFPLRERLRGAQMLALHRSGDTQAALAVYRDLETLLLDEYGVEPGPALQQLHTQLQSTTPNPTGTPADAAVPGGTGEWVRRGDGRDWWLGRGWPVDLADVIPPQRPLWGRVVLKTVAVVLTVGTLGFGGAAGTAAVAYRRGSRFLGLVAASYFVVWFTGFALTGTELERRLMSDLGLAMMLIVTVVSAIHLATVVAPVSVRRIRALAALERRRFAGELIARDPDWARQVGIGRPHLARGYDDGGLVDPNEVPAGVLTRIPGVTPQHAALIVTEREHHGPYRTVEDLGRRRLFPSPVPPAVAEFLVILPPAGGAR